MLRNDLVFPFQYVLNKWFEFVSSPAFASLKGLVVVTVDKDPKIDKFQQRRIRPFCYDDFEFVYFHFLDRDPVFIERSRAAYRSGFRPV